MSVYVCVCKCVRFFPFSDFLLCVCFSFVDKYVFVLVFVRVCVRAFVCL